MKITALFNEYRFLSNFYQSPLIFQGNRYKNSEAAYQSMKCVSEKDKELFFNVDPKTAKNLGRIVDIRSDVRGCKMQILSK